MMGIEYLPPELTGKKGDYYESKQQTPDIKGLYIIGNDHCRCHHRRPDSNRCTDLPRLLPEHGEMEIGQITSAIKSIEPVSTIMERLVKEYNDARAAVNA